jgi:cytochrome c553
MTVNKRNTWVTVIATAAWLGFCGAAAADVAEIVKSCDGCHTGSGDLPAIAGLSEFYQSDQLYFYRDEERPCIDTPDPSGETTNMCAVTADLSDDQIDEIAAHYAAMPFVAVKQDFDGTLAASGQQIHDRGCAMCHTDGGGNAGDDAGILAGQSMGYLKMTFDQYRAGEREQPSPMKSLLDVLSDDDVKALLHYYASQQ